MAAVAFPSIKPTGRSYSPGTYPQAEFRAINGATTTLRYGNRRFDSSLQLDFTNITDARAAEILKNYEDVTVADDWVTFTTSDGAAGASADLADYLREVGGSGLRWRYDGPPAVQSVKAGVSTVQVKFIGRLDPS